MVYLLLSLGVDRRGRHSKVSWEKVSGTDVTLRSGSQHILVSESICPYVIMIFMEGPIYSKM